MKSFNQYKKETAINDLQTLIEQKIQMEKEILKEYFMTPKGAVGELSNKEKFSKGKAFWYTLASYFGGKAVIASLLMGPLAITYYGPFVVLFGVVLSIVGVSGLISQFKNVIKNFVNKKSAEKNASEWSSDDLEKVTSFGQNTYYWYTKLPQSEEKSVLGDLLERLRIAMKKANVNEVMSIVESLKSAVENLKNTHPNQVEMFAKSF